MNASSKPVATASLRRPTIESRPSTDAAFYDRFVGIGTRLRERSSSDSSSTVDEMLAPDHPTASRCSTRLFVDADGRARVAAMINPRLADDRGVPIGLLGFFESVNDGTVADAILDQACGFLRDQGCTAARGPMAFTTWHDYRFTVYDSEPGPFRGEPAHADYYPALWERAGFAIDARYRSTWMGPGAALLDRFAPAARRAAEAGVRLRPLSDAGELGVLFQLSRRAFADAYMYSDIELDELAALYPADRVVGLTTGIYLAVHESAGPVGFLYTTPAEFATRGDVSVAKTIAVDPAWRGHGVYKAMLHRWIADRLADGPCDFVAALMHHDGEPARMGWSSHDVLREYALYERRF